MADLFERYVAEHLPSKAPAAAADDRSMWQHLHPAGDRQHEGCRPQPMRTWIGCTPRSAGRSRSAPTGSSRCSARRSTSAIRWGWRSDNPASGVRRNHEEKRERYLTPKEMLRLTAALATPCGAHQRRCHSLPAADRRPPLRGIRGNLGSIRSRERRLGEAVSPYKAA